MSPEEARRRSPLSRFVSDLTGRYIMTTTGLVQVEHIYGPKMFGHLINNLGEELPDLVIVEMKDGMELLKEIPEGYIADTSEEIEEAPELEALPRARGPKAWEVLNFLYRHANDEWTLRGISSNLGFGGDPGFALSKGRMIRYLRWFGDFVVVYKSGREHAYQFNDTKTDAEVIDLLTELKAKVRGKSG